MESEHWISVCNRSPKIYTSKYITVSNSIVQGLSFKVGVVRLVKKLLSSVQSQSLPIFP
jgi:hypothetical protein